MLLDGLSPVTHAVCSTGVDKQSPVLRSTGPFDHDGACSSPVALVSYLGTPRMRGYVLVGPIGGGAMEVPTLPILEPP